MYDVTIDMCYLEKFGEMLPGDRTNVETYLSDLVKHILLEFFMMASIDQVRICHLPGLEEEGQIFSAYIAARCISAACPLFPQELVRIELALEDRISCIFLELVAMVDVEDISIMSSA